MTERQPPGETTRPVATVDGVGRSFGDVDVLDDVSFDLASGRITALIGPNGAGKTTLLRIVAGLLAPSAGRVETAIDPSGRVFGYLPQKPSFRPTFTVGETLGFYADLADDPTPVEDRLRQVGLADVRDRRVDALSGGMVRLLGLAQSMVGDPPIMVLDEPTSSLDPEMTAHLFDVVADRVADGVAVLLTTHDLATVERAADDVVLLDRGRTVASGPVEAVLDRADADSLVEAFSALVARDDAALTIRAGTGESA